jgi:hypothetical protein
MNWKKLFYTPPSEITVAKVKMQAVVFLGFGVFYMLLFLNSCIRGYYSDSGRILLKVNAYNVPQKLYKGVDFDFGYYLTGVEGTLYYKPSSIVDFFVLETIGGSNVIDFLFILVCSILIYKSISKITERNPFSKGRVKTF